MSVEQIHDHELNINALVLSGGGANGAYEVGVLKALLEGASPATEFKPLSLAVATGTSIGAFNASALVSRLSGGSVAAAIQIEKIWLEEIPQDDSTNHNHIFRFRGDPFEFLNPNLLLSNPLLPFQKLAQDSAYLAQDWLSSVANTLRSDGTLVARLAGLIDFSAFVTNEPAQRLVHQVIDPLAIRESEIRLRIASTNWDTGVVKVFGNADMIDDYADRIVLASTAIPGLFPPVMIDGDSYVDGGVVMNTPLLPALRACAELPDKEKKHPNIQDTLHLVYLDPDVKSIPLGALHSTLDTMVRMFTVQFASTMSQDIKQTALVNRALHANTPAADIERITGVKKPRKVAIHRYHPRDDLGGGILGWLDFSRERVQRLIDRGFRDAKEHDCHRSECVLADGRILSAKPAEIAPNE